MIPIVDVHCKYKRPLRYGETVRLEVEFIPTEAAKMVFKYLLFNARSGELVATGSSVQVFLDKEQSILQLSNPPFFEDWKKKQGLT